MHADSNGPALHLGGFGGQHAIVIGASTSGLAAAAAAGRHFARVTVLERDSLPEKSDTRRGVPQGRHVHALLKGGQNVFNHYFPGLTAHMLAQGASEVDIGQHIAWHHFGGWKTRFSSGVTMQCQTKGFLEWHVRQRLMQWPNVQMLEKSEVTGLNLQSGRISGVQLRSGATLEADLVIDAGGRNSQMPFFLKDLGIKLPETSELPVEIGYASQLFLPDPNDTDHDWRGMLIHSRPPATRTAALMPVEGGRWIVTLVGWGGDLPGKDEGSFLEWARGLPVPDLYHAIRRAKPVDRVWSWRFPSNQRRHYERHDKLPDGIVVVGDANTSLNPIYAQGMSQGAIGASILDTVLHEQRKRAGPMQVAGLSARFHRAYAGFLDQCWMTSTTEDYCTLGPASKRAWYTPMLSSYMHRFAQLTWHDQKAALAFFDVMHMQKPPSSLMTPRFLFKALGQRRRAKQEAGPQH